MARRFHTRVHFWQFLGTLLVLSASLGMADCDKSSNLAGTSSVSVTKPSTGPSSQAPSSPSSSTPPSPLTPSSPPPPLPPPSLSASAVQRAYLKASNTGIYDEFGSSVALDGDTLVVGAPYEDSNAVGVGAQANNDAPDSGAVYVFTRSGGTWSQQAYLKASNPQAYDTFGASVAISGDTLVVGAPGEDSNETGLTGTGTNDSALDSGAVYVFTRSGSTWVQQLYVKASNTDVNDFFGSSVAISGDTLVVSAPGEDSNETGVTGTGTGTNDSAIDSGAVYVFTRSGNVWSQQAYLKASNSDPSDRFGHSLAIDGDTLVVGASNESSATVGINGVENNNGAPASGAAYVFTRSGGTWSQQAYVKPSNTGTFDHFGVSVALSTDTLVVGAHAEASNAKGVNGDGANNDASDSGAAYVFTRSGSTWSQQAYLKASNADIFDFFGASVAISGDVVAVGAYNESSNATGVNGDQTNNSVTHSGAVYVFARSGSTWAQQIYVKASNTGANDYFGSSLALNGDTLAVAVGKEDSNSTGVNNDDTNNLGGDSGAVYVFQ